ncbi:MAG: hypothetical protein JOY77_05645 [Alphaproteobacteria bacterium]|nr:hypothetical protein [Alphaproteobacteria bacterium]
MGQGLQTAQGLPQIQESYATSNVTVFASSKPKTYAGGLVGIGAGTISNSYATGSITGGNKDNLGGLVGGSENTAISHAYAVGAVSDSSYAGGVGGRIKSPQFDRVYWDTDTSGRTSACGRDRTCNGAAGLTDAQLKSGLPDGFDPKIWAQDPNINNGYPYLRNNPPQ